MDNLSPIEITKDLPKIPLPGLPLPVAVVEMRKMSPALFMAMSVFMWPDFPAPKVR